MEHNFELEIILINNVFQCLTFHERCEVWIKDQNVNLYVLLEKADFFLLNAWMQLVKFEILYF